MRLQFGLCRNASTIVAGIVALSSIAPVAAGAQEGPSATAVMNQYVAAVNARQFQKLRGVLSRTLVQHFSDAGMSVYGPDAVIARFKGVIKTTPDLHLSLARLIAQGDTFATIMNVSYTRGGKPVHQFWIDVWRVSHGKIAEHWES